MGLGLSACVHLGRNFRAMMFVNGLGPVVVVMIIVLVVVVFIAVISKDFVLLSVM